MGAQSEFDQGQLFFRELSEPDRQSDGGAVTADSGADVQLNDLIFPEFGAGGLLVRSPPKQYRL